MAFFRSARKPFAVASGQIVQARPHAGRSSSTPLFAAAAALGSVAALGFAEKRFGHPAFAQCEEFPRTRFVSTEEQFLLSADCGGTTTRLMLYRVSSEAPILPGSPAPGVLVCEKKYPNIFFSDLSDIMEKFLRHDCGVADCKPTVAVLALAGIVINNQCRFTNLDWVVNGNALAEKFDIPRVELINDFVAQGYGMLTLGDHEVTRLNDVAPQLGAPIACIGAGTGLGQCFLVADPSGEYRAYPSEGAHVEFGPRDAGSDDLQIRMLKYLKIKLSGWNRISVERVVSGMGIGNIYLFLAHTYPDKVDVKVHQKYLARPADAGVIAAGAYPGSLCEHALKIFAGSYGAACGNLALSVQPFGGLYITGGVTNRMADFLFEDPAFMAGYHDKGRVSPLLDHIPLILVKGDDMGQRGAHHRAVWLLKQLMEGRSCRVAAPNDEIKPESLVPARGLSDEVSELVDIIKDYTSGESF